MSHMVNIGQPLKYFNLNHLSPCIEKHCNMMPQASQSGMAARTFDLEMTGTHYVYIYIYIYNFFFFFNVVACKRIALKAIPRSKEILQKWPPEPGQQQIVQHIRVDSSHQSKARKKHEHLYMHKSPLVSINQYLPLQFYSVLCKVTH